MSDIRDKARQDRNWVERLLHHIPGFGGYLGKEERRETDKLLRVQLAGKLDRIRERLDPVMRDLTDGGALAMVGDVDRLKKSIGHVADKVRYASYGYSGWFDVVKVREGELDRLYEFDLALVDSIGVLEDLINRVRSGAANAQGLKPVLEQASNVIREFDERLDRRFELITGYSVDG